MTHDGKIRALLLENIHPDAVLRLESEGYQVETLGGALDEDELIERIADVTCSASGPRPRSPRGCWRMRRGSPRSAPSASAPTRSTCRPPPDAGVAVFNAPFSNTRSVVELAIGEIIALTRRLTEKNSAMHAGVWDKDAGGSHEVRGRTLGIVGYGNIGTQLSVLAENLGMSVYFYDTADKLALGNAHRCETLDELLEVADVVTLHVDGRAGNSGFFGEEQFARMRPGSLFLNLSRGFVIDHAALRRHLDSGHIAGAAVDVFPVEPKARGDEFVSELRGLPNVILTPHIGGSTEEAQADIGAVRGEQARLVRRRRQHHAEREPAADRAAAAGRPPTGSPTCTTTCPVCWPQVNSILAAHSVNIEGQLLATRGEFGYLLTDVGSDYSDDVLDELRAMAATIGLRVLS